MTIDRAEIEKYFSVGDVVKYVDGSNEEKVFTITKITNKMVNISIQDGNLHYPHLSVVIENVNEKDKKIDELFVQKGLGKHSKKSQHRALAKEYLKRKNSNPPSLLEIQTEFELAVEKSKQSSPSERQARLQNAPQKPEKVISTSVSFRRNPDVVAEVLARANGICEQCNKPAPFNRKKDNTPYLEVHHKQRLADDGDDTVENAIALCPNCHRQAHFG